MADDLYGDEESNDSGMLGGLGMASRSPDLLSHIALFDQPLRQQGQPQQQGPSSLLDVFRKRIMGILPPEGYIDEARSKWEGAAQQAQDPRTKWLQFSAGMLSPTKTGSFGESLGYGLKGLAEGMQREQGIGANLAQQRFQDSMSLEKLGLQGAHLDATLQAIQGRMNRPSPEAVKAMSRADLSGKPRNSPEWQAAFQGEMQKAQFFTGMSPNMQEHIRLSGNPDDMTIEQMRTLGQQRMGVIDKRADDAAQLKTNPLHSYGVPDFEQFMKDTSNLSGDELYQALPPMLKADVDNLRGGNIAVPTLSGRSNANATNLLLGLTQRIDPEFSTARNKMMNDYKGNKPNTTGFNITAIRTGIDHMATLKEIAAQMGNSRLQGENLLVNTAKKWTGNENITNANLAATAIAHEMARVFKGSGAMADRDIQDFERQLSAKILAPGQMEGVLRTAAKLFHGRMKEINEPWKAEFKKDFPILPEGSEVEKSFNSLMQGTKSSGNPWLDKAITANPGMTREQVIAEGKKRGKLPDDYSD